MTALRKPCPACAGRGIVPRARRVIEGSPDPFDTRIEELCGTCGGSGSVRDTGPTADAPKAAADLDYGSCCY